MIARPLRHSARLLLVALLAAAGTTANAQGFADSAPGISLDLPPLNNFASPEQKQGRSLAAATAGKTTLAARLVGEGEDISRGLMWRIFKPQAGSDGKLPLVASAQGGTSVFDLPPGSYLVHAAFGRAGATKRITVGRDSQRETIVLDAGGLELDAVLEGGKRIAADQLKFSIYEANADEQGERALIIPNVKPSTVVRLNSGVYHVVSTYGSVNAVIRSDIRVEAGKLTEATVEHRAAEITLKLVRDRGGEAIADTSWSVLTASGDPIRESVGAYASMVLAEGEYTIIAKNRDRIYQRALTIEAGSDQDVEVLATEEDAIPEGEITD
ncbi:hypothetical protein [Arvimicrobium flavum]|uniref:hypothetical protein n=1 Tax=Arvimicrobium flavum TaxID=3393320 RepID=UPI00237A1A3C|nr:hypothetical protein [Mesorhizobium shangrilense]